MIFQSEVMQNASNMAFRNLFGSGEGFNWALVAQTDPVGNMVGKLLRGEPLSPETKTAIDDNKTNSQQDSKKAEGFFGFLDKLDESIGGIFLSMKNGLGGFAGSLGHEFTGLVSTLGNAVGAGWDSLTALGSEFIEKAGNWIGGFGFSTDMEIIDAEARAIEERRSNAFMSRLDEIQSKGTKNLYDVNYYLAKAMGLKPGESMNHLAETLGYENSQKLKEAFTKGEVKLSELVDASGINTSGDISQFAQDFAFASQAREQKNAAARLAREYRESALDNARETDYNLRQQELGTHSEAEQIYNQNQFNEASGLTTAKRILSSFQGLFGFSGGNEERDRINNNGVGSDVEQIRQLVIQRGDSWDNGVHVIGLRNDTVASGRNKNTHDDIFIVIAGGEITGAFAGSTDPGAPNPKKTKIIEKIKKLGGMGHLPEGEYDYLYVNNGKNPGKKQKYNDVFVPKNDLEVYRDTSGNGFIDGDEINKKWGNAGRNSWFHAGDDANKPVNGYSFCCQIIALDRYWDSEKGFVDFNKYEDVTGYKGKNNQKAYNVFLKKINGRDVTYHLFNQKRSKYHQHLYNKYRGLLEL